MSKQWRPWSSEEAADFDDRFCSQCIRDAAFRAGTGDSCEIAADGFGVALGLEPPPQWIEDEDGPGCTAFEALP